MYFSSTRIQFLYADQKDIKKEVDLVSMFSYKPVFVSEVHVKKQLYFRFLLGNWTEWQVLIQGGTNFEGFRGYKYS